MATLEMIQLDLEVRRDDTFWRPERIRRLLQLAVFGPLLPRWATSRWILEQAAQTLDRRGRGRALKAIEIAVEMRGGEQTLVGTDALDARAKVMDHDWVFRQLLLYDFGGLQDFVARIASSELLAGADRIHEWARTPMGGFRLLRESPSTLTWQNLNTQAEVESLNLGSASLVAHGECVIGRLVPVDEGAMFETAPLFVPDSLAQLVADDPQDWVAAMSAECRRERPVEQRIETGGFDFRLLTDVPVALEQIAVHALVERDAEERAAPTGSADPVAARVALLRAALDDKLDDVDLFVSPWPSVAASLLDPGVFLTFSQTLLPQDRPKLGRLADLLARPADAVFRRLADDLEGAA